LQVVAFFLLPGLFIQAFLGIGTLIQDIRAGSYSGLASALFPTVLLLLVTILFGRFFCGYLCAFGSLSDGMTFIGHDLFRLKTRMPEKVGSVFLSI
jgi:polyferredoxin